MVTRSFKCSRIVVCPSGEEGWVRGGLWETGISSRAYLDLTIVLWGPSSEERIKRSQLEEIPWRVIRASFCLEHLRLRSGFGLGAYSEIIRKTAEKSRFPFVVQ